MKEATRGRGGEAARMEAARVVGQRHSVGEGTKNILPTRDVNT
jgi:hypothetical protein